MDQVPQASKTLKMDDQRVEDSRPWHSVGGRSSTELKWDPEFYRGDEIDEKDEKIGRWKSATIW
jgi:hypothetical protein